MNFDILPMLISFHDTRPGEHATLLCNGERLLFRGDLSKFSDEKQSYLWVFEGWVAEGDRVTFVTNDREVSGVVCGRTIVVDGANNTVGADAETVSVFPAAAPAVDLPTIEQVLSSANPRAPLRPVPLKRSFG